MRQHTDRGNSLRPGIHEPTRYRHWRRCGRRRTKGRPCGLEYRIKQLTRTEKERLIHEDTAFSQLLPQLEVSRYRRRPGITLEMCLEGKIDA